MVVEVEVGPVWVLVREIFGFGVRDGRIFWGVLGGVLGGVLDFLVFFAAGG